MLSKPESVRIATEADIPALYWHTYASWLDNYMQLPFSPRRVLATVSDCARGNMGIAGIIDGPSEPIGTIGINMTQPVYSDFWILAEVWLFVAPEHRAKAPYWQMLFDFALWHREDMAAKVSQPILPLELNVYSLNRLPQKERLWRKNALQVGAMFWAGVNPGA